MPNVFDFKKSFAIKEGNIFIEDISKSNSMWWHIANISILVLETVTLDQNIFLEIQIYHLSLLFQNEKNSDNILI